MLYLGKAALAVLHALLQPENSQKYQDPCAFVESAQGLYPVLRSCLEDFDTSLRELSIRSVKLPMHVFTRICSCLTYLFKMFPKNALHEHVTHEIYPAIVQRLDDSIDNIRLTACRAFVA